MLAPHLQRRSVLQSLRQVFARNELKPNGNEQAWPHLLHLVLLELKVELLGGFVNPIIQGSQLQRSRTHHQGKNKFVALRRLRRIGMAPSSGLWADGTPGGSLSEQLHAPRNHVSACVLHQQMNWLR